MDRHQVINGIFGVNRALIGAIHVGGLPGTPSHNRSLPEIVDAAVAEARLYVSAGFHGVVIENTHDRPYLKGTAGPEIVASLAVIGQEIRRAVPSAPLGVQILAGANQAALAVALACGASFVRVEGFVFAHVADEGLIESSAAALLRYRRAIGAEGIRVFADIKKKHSAHAMTADVSLVETAKAAEFFLVDGVIVTGIATGEPTDAGEVRSVASAIGVPVLVGSGVTSGNLRDYDAADALIVGSDVKRDGLWSNPLDEARTRAIVSAFEKRSSP
jgi:membrane complex biogenesis BtpA family protein